MYSYLGVEAPEAEPEHADPEPQANPTPETLPLASNENIPRQQSTFVQRDPDEDVDEEHEIPAQKHRPPTLQIPSGDDNLPMPLPTLNSEQVIAPKRPSPSLSVLTPLPNSNTLKQGEPSPKAVLKNEIEEEEGVYAEKPHAMVRYQTNLFDDDGFEFDEDDEDYLKEAFQVSSEPDSLICLEIKLYSLFFDRHSCKCLTLTAMGKLQRMSLALQ